ncbi:MAG: hypothetical protein VR72_11220 [Clostridiaceae bacterium BRH_c20a]|nr:MAG: hypothetical protein VR72_11220 [Clostridiaceae bacterium BRH_c20a]
MLSSYLQELGKVGIGEFGLWRSPYTQEYEEAANLVAGWMKEHGFEVKKDGIGNIIGRIEGTDNQARAVTMGSHLDTVRGGGIYDGMLGVAGGIIAAGYLLKTYGRPQNPIEVIAFIGEEGSRFSGLMGSKWMAGDLEEKELVKVDENGISLKAAAQAFGYSLSPSGSTPRSDVEAFLELHIEQGPVLEAKGCPIGIVSGITGMRQAELTIRGRSDHAGTTPMGMRHDALLAAAKMIGAMDLCVRQSGGDTVFTVGRISANPGAVNVVAAETVFTIDMRDPDPKKLKGLYSQLEEETLKVAAQTGVLVEWKNILAVEPVPCSPILRDILAEAARKAGLDYHEMVSGAGHDAIMAARFAPIGMLFVPSTGGRSHCGEEYTSPSQCMAGVTVLAEAIRQLAYKNKY